MIESSLAWRGIRATAGLGILLIPGVMWDGRSRHEPGESLRLIHPDNPIDFNVDLTPDNAMAS